MNWSPPVLVDPGATAALVGVSCPSVGLCVAVDGSGRVITSTAPSAETGWRVARLHGAPQLVDVSCPSTSLCIAVDFWGNVWSSTNPTGGSRAWGIVHAPTGGAEGASFAAVSCPSVSLCVAVDANGDVWSSTDPAGGPGAWSRAHVAPGDLGGLTGVSCPSSSLCVAVDADGGLLSSTDPTGGPRAWSRANSGVAALDSVSCASMSLCIAVGLDAWSTTDPTGGSSAWHVMYLNADWDIAGGMLSCPLVSFCALGGADGGVVTSDDPAGGDRAWSFTHVDGTNSLRGMSCPSVSLCVAVDDAGNVVVGAPTAPSVPVPVVAIRHGSSAASIKARRHGRSLRVDLGLAVFCPPAGPACNVTGDATSSPFLGGPRRVGRIQIRVPAGRSRKLTFALTSRAARILLQRHSFDVAVRFVARDGSGYAVGDGLQFSLLRPSAVPSLGAPCSGGAGCNGGKFTGNFFP